MNSTILAVDCSQRVTTIVVGRGPVVFERQFDPAAVRDREPIWDELKELCEEAHVEPWQFDAVGVTTEGLAYPLRRETLLVGRTRGLSNRRTERTAEVRLEGGRLLVIETPATL